VYNQNPSQGQSQYRGMQTSFQPTGFVNSVYGQGQGANFGASQQFTNPQSFHTAQYKGNQPGHDTNLRADSVNPAQQSQFGFNQNQWANQNQFGNQQSFQQNLPSQYGMNSNQFGTQQSQFGRAPYTTTAAGIGSSSFGNFGGVSSFGGNPTVSQQSYHLNNYRGNQPGHDISQRADSINPSQQSQFQSPQYQQSQYSTGFYGQGQ